MESPPTIIYGIKLSPFPHNSASHSDCCLLQALLIATSPEWIVFQQHHSFCLDGGSLAHGHPDHRYLPVYSKLELLEDLMWN